MEDVWREQIGSRFPDWGTDAALARWPDNRARLSIGSVVRGEVVACAPFGVWVDIAAAHPALLLVHEMAGAQTRRILFDDYPALGTVVEAWVVSLGPRAEIALSQNPKAAEMAQRQAEPGDAADGGNISAF